MRIYLYIYIYTYVYIRFRTVIRMDTSAPYCPAVCCSMLQCAAEWKSVLQRG